MKPRWSGKRENKKKHNEPVWPAADTTSELATRRYSVTPLE